MMQKPALKWLLATALFFSCLFPCSGKMLSLEKDLSSLTTLVTIVFSRLKITRGLKIFFFLRNWSSNYFGLSDLKSSTSNFCVCGHFRRVGVVLNGIQCKRRYRYFYAMIWCAAHSAVWSQMQMAWAKRTA